jgi:hypothetical protein
MKKFVKVMSLEEALTLNGETVEQFNYRTERDSDGEKAGKELDAMSKAINGGEHMDYKDTRVPKWSPVFWSVGSGSGFAFYYSHCVISNSYVGARHTVFSEEASDFFGTQHADTWNRYINGQ